MNRDPAEIAEGFEHWLVHMDDALEAFLSALPDPTGLDYSVESLDRAAALILDRYPDIAAARAPSEATWVDGMTRYVGEVFRIHLGAKWRINSTEPKRAWFGVPVLFRVGDRPWEDCPITLVLATADRRRNDYLSQILKNQLARRSS